jgi:hypothetical protein
MLDWLEDDILEDDELYDDTPLQEPCWC